MSNDRDQLKNAETPVLESDPDLLTIDGVDIVSVLGTGGTSTVYKGIQTTLSREVAVKILHRFMLTDTRNLQRFRQEAKVSTILDHPNIASVYGLGATADKRPYIVMEYCTGETLKDMVESGREISIREIKQIFAQVCAGLSEAHSHNIVHRDLKPANVYMRKNDDGELQVKLIDFGIAKLLNPDAHEQKLTSTGMVIGTPHYMCPEQCTGEQLDARADIYALGCMLYYAVCGKVPFDGESSYEIAGKHIGEPVPHMVRPDGKPVDDAMQQLVCTAMAKKREERFASVNDFAAALNAVPEVVRKRSVRLKPSAKPKPVPKPKRANWKVVWAAAALVAVLASVAYYLVGPQGTLVHPVAANKELQEAEALFNSGNYESAAPKLVELRKQRLSNEDATRLLFDLTDLAQICEEDRPSVRELQLPPPTRRDSNEAAIAICRLMNDMGENAPSALARSWSNVISAGITVHPEQQVPEKLLHPGLSREDSALCLGRLKTRLSQEPSWEPDTRPTARRMVDEAIQLLNKSGRASQVMRSQHILGDYYAADGDFGHCKDEYLKALPLVPVAAKEPATREGAATLSVMGRLACGYQQFDVAQEALDGAERMYKEKCGSGSAMSYFYRSRAQLEVCRKNYKKAMEYYKDALRFEPRNRSVWFTKVDLQGEMAICYDMLGDHQSALNASLIQLNGVRRDAKPDERAGREPAILTRIADEYDKLKKPAEALATRKQLLPYVERNFKVAEDVLLKSRSLDAAMPYHAAGIALAGLYNQMGQRNEAIATAKREVDVLKKTTGDTAALVWAYTVLSAYDWKDEDRIKALENSAACADRLDEKEKNLPFLTAILSPLAVTYAERDRWNEAQPLLERVRSYFEKDKTIPQDGWRFLVPYALANAYYAQGKTDQAMEIYRELMPKLKVGQRMDSLSIRLAWENYKALLLKTKQ